MTTFRCLLLRLVWLLTPLALAMAALLISVSVADALAQPGTLPALFAIRDGERHGLIDITGRVVLPTEYDDIKLGEPLVMVRRGARTAYADASGRFVIAPQEAWTQPFAEGLVPAAQKDAAGRFRWGYADPAGTMVIAPTFESAGPFSGGLAVVAVADSWGELKYGAIDRTGRLVVPAVHEKLLAPAAGLVRSESKQRTHRVFDARGRDLTPPPRPGAPGQPRWLHRQTRPLGDRAAVRQRPRFSPRPGRIFLAGGCLT